MNSEEWLERLDGWEELGRFPYLWAACCSEREVEGSWPMTTARLREHLLGGRAKPLEASEIWHELLEQGAFHAAELWLDDGRWTTEESGKHDDPLRDQLHFRWRQQREELESQRERIRTRADRLRRVLEDLDQRVDLEQQLERSSRLADHRCSRAKAILDRLEERLDEELDRWYQEFARKEREGGGDEQNVLAAKSPLASDEDPERTLWFYETRDSNPSSESHQLEALGSITEFPVSRFGPETIAEMLKEQVPSALRPWLPDPADFQARSLLKLVERLLGPGRLDREIVREFALQLGFLLTGKERPADVETGDGFFKTRLRGVTSPWLSTLIELHGEDLPLVVLDRTGALPDDEVLGELPLVFDPFGRLDRFRRGGLLVLAPPALLTLLRRPEQLDGQDARIWPFLKMLGPQIPYYRLLPVRAPSFRRSGLRGSLHRPAAEIFCQQERSSGPGLGPEDFRVRLRIFLTLLGMEARQTVIDQIVYLSSLRCDVLLELLRRLFRAIDEEGSEIRELPFEWVEEIWSSSEFQEAALGRIFGSLDDDPAARFLLSGLIVASRSDPDGSRSIPLQEVTGLLDSDVQDRSGDVELAAPALKSLGVSTRLGPGGRRAKFRVSGLRRLYFESDFAFIEELFELAHQEIKERS